MAWRIGVLLSVLVALTSADAAAAAGPGWSTARSMSVARVGHTATLLPNGKVLVAGGAGTRGAELYNPATDTWSGAGTMVAGRGGHAALLLPNGKVLVVGGQGPGVTAELYDPATNAWTAAPPPGLRFLVTATRLADGRALVTGTDPAARIYAPATNSWSPAAAPTVSEGGASATLLHNGRVLVAGGGSAGLGDQTDKAELYTPQTDSWSPTGSLLQERTRHEAVRLTYNNRVLAVGGNVNRVSIELAELFDPASGKWFKAPPMGNARAGHTATAIANSRVLVVGGSNKCCAEVRAVPTAEVYDPVTGLWSGASCMTTPRFRHTATRLANGRVLVTGGTTDASDSLSSAEVYDPAVDIPRGSGCSTIGLSWDTSRLQDLGTFFGSTGVGDRPYWLAVSAGVRTTAHLRSDGTVWTAGDNALGQRGNGTTVQEPSFTFYVSRSQAAGLGGVKAIASGKSHVMALRSDGTVWTWGNNSAGQLGYGTICGQDCVGSTVPRQVPGLTGVKAIAAGGFHSLALKTDGTLVAWGQGGQGQLGNGVLRNTTTPTTVRGLGGVSIKSVVGSVLDSMIVTTSGEIWGWGANNAGEVTANGSHAQVNLPFRVTSITGVRELAQGRYFTVALKPNGNVFAWGMNDYGQLGRGAINSPRSSGVPTQVPGLKNVVAVSAHREFALALDASGDVFGWGRGVGGHLEYPEPENFVPVDTATPAKQGTDFGFAGITGGLGARAIAAGYDHWAAVAP